LKKKYFVLCILKNNNGKVVKLDFSDKFGQYNSFKNEIGTVFDYEFIQDYNRSINEFNKNNHCNYK